MIKKGLKIEFVAKDIENNDVDINNYKGIKIISLYPQLNTRICDAQTGIVSDWSEKYENITFISISSDSTKVAKKWCGVNGPGNSHILSDKEYKNFGETYNLLSQPGIMKRGFIILNESNEVLDFDTGENAGPEHKENHFDLEPNYELVENFLVGLN